MKHVIRLALFALVYASAAHAEHITVIRAGHLVDVIAGKELDDQVIVIADDRVREVGPSGSVKVPANADVIDLTDTRADLVWEAEES